MSLNTARSKLKQFEQLASVPADGSTDPKPREIVTPTRQALCVLDVVRQSLTACSRAVEEYLDDIGAGPTRPRGALVPRAPDPTLARAESPPSGTTFVANSGGYGYDVPAGWVGRAADNGKGIVFHAPGSTGNADMIRIMDPTPR